MAKQKFKSSLKLITYYIYNLSNPINGDIFYVGFTSRPEIRIKQHCFQSRGNSLKDKYIRNMSNLPVMNILEEVSGETEKTRWVPGNVRAAEYYMIKKFKDQGCPLTNVIICRWSYYSLYQKTA